MFRALSIKFRGLTPGLVLTRPLVPLHMISPSMKMVLIIFPRIFKWLSRKKYSPFRSASGTGYVLVICFLFSLVANILDINIIFGALVAGMVLQSNLTRDSKIKEGIKDVSLGFFIPIYFGIVGLKLDLIHHFDIVFFLQFLVIATIVKTGGAMLSARLVNKSWLSCLNLGVAMNARGGPGIILASLAYELGIINESFFATLIMLSIITSLLSGYWFKLLLNRKIPLLKG